MYLPVQMHNHDCNNWDRHTRAVDTVSFLAYMLEEFM